MTFQAEKSNKKESMNKYGTISRVMVGLSLSFFSSAPLLHAADTYNKSTTTVEKTTTQTSTAPRRAVKKAAPVTTTTSNTTTMVTREGEMRKVLDENALKKMSDSLCVKGFRAYVGNDKKNLCQGKATSPDIAYSCVWSEDGNAAYSPTTRGPCALEHSEHQESIAVSKDDYSSHPPLAYGTEAHCCFRAAQGPPTSTMEKSPTVTTVAPK
jgi:hypothetical protein